jgi:hypothetical protein
VVRNLTPTALVCRYRNKQKFLEDTDARVFEKEKAMRSTVSLSHFSVLSNLSCRSSFSRLMTIRSLNPVGVRCLIERVSLTHRYATELAEEAGRETGQGEAMRGDS